MPLYETSDWNGWRDSNPAAVRKSLPILDRPPEPSRTACADRACPSREQCKRYVSLIRGFGVATAYADFNRAEGAEKCAEGFEIKLTH